MPVGEQSRKKSQKKFQIKILTHIERVMKNNPNKTLTTSAYKHELLSQLARLERNKIEFDSSPDYTLSGMRFAENAEKTFVLDFFGSSATGSIRTIMELLDDRDLAENWSRMVENGK